MNISVVLILLTGVVGLMAIFLDLDSVLFIKLLLGWSVVIVTLAAAWSCREKEVSKNENK